MSTVEQNEPEITEFVPTPEGDFQLKHLIFIDKDERFFSTPGTVLNPLNKQMISLNLSKSMRNTHADFLSIGGSRLVELPVSSESTSFSFLKKQKKTAQTGKGHEGNFVQRVYVSDAVLFS